MQTRCSQCLCIEKSLSIAHPRKWARESSSPRGPKGLRGNFHSLRPACPGGGAAFRLARCSWFWKHPYMFIELHMEKMSSTRGLRCGILIHDLLRSTQDLRNMLKMGSTSCLSVQRLKRRRFDPDEDCGPTALEMAAVSLATQLSLA